MDPNDLEFSRSWNLSSGLIDFLPRGEDRPLIPLLIQLEKGTSPRDFARLATPQVIVPELYTQVLPSLDPRFDELEYITVLADLNFLRDMPATSRAALAPRMVDVELSPPLRRNSHHESIQWTSTGLAKQTGSPNQNVVLGIIDDGIAFAHNRFLGPGGTRVEYFWMQDGPPPGPVDIFGPSASGRELSKLGIWAQMGIDDLRLTCTHAGTVDEDEVYTLAGVIDPAFPIGHKAIRWHLAHGTHVLDIACNTPVNAAVDRRIIAVQLPVATTGLQPTANLSTHVINGIWYILLRSLRVAVRLGCGTLPVVINLSYGITHGPHDGTHLIEGAIDQILAMWSLIMGVQAQAVIGSGNSYLERLHARVPLHPVDDPPRKIFWQIQPDDQTPSVVEVWMPQGIGWGPGRFQLQVFGPGGAGPASVQEIPWQVAEWNVGGEVLCRVKYRFMPQSSRGRFRITVQPTARVDPIGPVAPCGTWRIELTNLGLPTGTVVHAYVARDKAPYGYPPSGRQSYFDDPDYVRYDDAGRPVELDNASIVQRNGSINGMATGQRPTVVGGFRRNERTIAPYSAGGPTPPPNGRNPDALAVSDDSVVCAGVLGAGSRSGAVAAMNGTSVAAPMVTAWVASRLAAGLPGGRPAVQAFAAAVDLTPPLPPERVGFGRIALPPATPRPGIAR